MVTAGAIKAIDAEFFEYLDEKRIPADKLTDAKDKLTLSQQATQAVTHATVEAGIKTAFNGGSFDDFTDEFAAAIGNQIGNHLINRFGEAVAKDIGGTFDNDELNKSNFDNLARYIAHAALGCSIGLGKSALSGSNSDAFESDCISGAGGAVIGTLTAEIYRDLVVLEDLSQDGLDNWKNTGANYAQMIAAVATMLGDGNVSIAASAAHNAALNNGLSHGDALTHYNNLIMCGDDLGCIAREKMRFDDMISAEEGEKRLEFRQVSGKTYQGIGIVHSYYKENPNEDPDGSIRLFLDEISTKMEQQYVAAAYTLEHKHNVPPDMVADFLYLNNEDLTMMINHHGSYYTEPASWPADHSLITINENEIQLNAPEGSILSDYVPPTIDSFGDPPKYGFDLKADVGDWHFSLGRDLANDVNKVEIGGSNLFGEATFDPESNNVTLKAKTGGDDLNVTGGTDSSDQDLSDLDSLSVGLGLVGMEIKSDGVIGTSLAVGKNFEIGKDSTKIGAEFKMYVEIDVDRTIAQWVWGTIERLDRQEYDLKKLDL